MTLSLCLARLAQSAVCYQLPLNAVGRSSTMPATRDKHTARCLACSPASSPEANHLACTAIAFVAAPFSHFPAASPGLPLRFSPDPFDLCTVFIFYCFSDIFPFHVTVSIRQFLYILSSLKAFSYSHIYYLLHSFDQIYLIRYIEYILIMVNY